MLYYVKLNDLIIFKGNFYACTDFINATRINQKALTITSRK